MEASQIEALAREAGFEELGDIYWNPHNNHLSVQIEGSFDTRYAIGDELTRFASLVEAAAMEKAAKVWLVWSGEHEQSYIYGVYDSLETAVAAIKAPYVAPYIVKWREPVADESGDYELTGDFTRVEGFCGDGPTTWEIEPRTVAAAIRAAAQKGEP